MSHGESGDEMRWGRSLILGSLNHVAAIPIARNSIIIVPLSTHHGSPEAYGLQCLLQDYVQFVDFDVFFHENGSFTILYHCDTTPVCDHLG
jgi:hypothetical protein